MHVLWLVDDDDDDANNNVKAQNIQHGKQLCTMNCKYRIAATLYIVEHSLFQVYSVEPSYNNIGLCNTSSIASDILLNHNIIHLGYNSALL